jgi:phenylacetate-CoA ligase
VNIFEYILSWQGYPIQKAIKRFQQLKSEFEMNPESFRVKYAWAIFHYHLNNNSFYRNFVGPQQIDEWSKIPLEKILSTGFTNKKVYISNTSGSSGHPFYFAKDKFAHAMAWANIQNQYGKIGLTTRSRQARFYGIPLNAMGYAKEKVKDLIASRVRFPVFDLQDKVIENWIQKFRHSNFQQINGYTSSVVCFAKYCTRKGIVLKNICPELRICIVTSEVCTPEDRKILERGLGVPVVNEYGASELGIIAFDTTGKEWPISEELLLLEVLDESNRPVPENQQGRIVCTSLFNKAFPLIRYEIGDIGSIKTINGRRHLIRLEGRINDMALLPSGKLSPGLTFYYISKSILEKTGDINEFIIKQVNHNTFRFVVNARRKLSLNDEMLIKEKMDKYLEPGLNLELEYVDVIQRPASGKIKHFYSEIT